MNEGLSNISTQIPQALARRLDAKCEIERKASPGTASRSNMIRAALVAFLSDIPDPKNETVAPRMSAGRPEALKGRPRTMKLKDTAASSPTVRIRQRPASHTVPVAE